MFLRQNLSYFKLFVVSYIESVEVYVLFFCLRDEKILGIFFRDYCGSSLFRVGNLHLVPKC